MSLLLYILQILNKIHILKNIIDLNADGTLLIDLQEARYRQS